MYDNFAIVYLVVKRKGSNFESGSRPGIFLPSSNSRRCSRPGRLPIVASAVQCARIEAHNLAALAALKMIEFMMIHHFKYLQEMSPLCYSPPLNECNTVGLVVLYSLRLSANSVPPNRPTLLHSFRGEYNIRKTTQ